MPLSISVTSTPPITSTGLPVGKSAPVIAPAMFSNMSGTAAAAPGTPSIAVAPA